MLPSSWRHRLVHAREAKGLINEPFWLSVLLDTSSGKRMYRNLGLVICNCKEGMLCLHVSDPEARQGLQTAGQRLQIPVKTGVVGAHW